MSATTAPAVPLPGPVQTPRGILLSGIRWPTYEAILADLEDRPIRLTYDRGRLEIMAPSFNHERCKKKVGRVVETLAEEKGLEIVSGGSATFRLEDLEKGLEPDDCFYIQNAALVLGKQQIDLAVDPPPDLVVEIDISSSSINRMAIYAALGVPEVWTYDGDELTVYVFEKNEYIPAKISRALPDVDLAGLEAFLRVNISAGDGTMVRLLRKWLRG